MNCYEQLHFLKETGALMALLVDTPDLPLNVRAELRHLLRAIEQAAAQIVAEVEHMA